MKIGRKIFYDKRQIPREDEFNRLIKREDTEDLFFRLLYYVPKLFFFFLFTSLFLLFDRSNAISLKKKTS